DVHADDRGDDHARHRRQPGRAGCEDEVLERVQGARPMVGRATAVLSVGRALALAALLGALVLYDAGAGTLPDVSLNWDTAFLAAILLPLTLTVVWLILPVAQSKVTLTVGVALVVAAVVLDLVGVGSVFNVAKLLALVALGFAFVRFFQPPLSWLV